MNQLSIDFAHAEARKGMARALEHAEADCPKWGDVALAFLTQFARTHKTFISEDVSDASKEWGMVQPPSDRAWGAIYRRAIKLDIIVQDGSGRSLRRHGSICPRWRSLVCA